MLSINLNYAEVIYKINKPTMLVVNNGFNRLNNYFTKGGQMLLNINFNI